MKNIRYITAGLFIFGLFAVRYFQEQLFYDPLLDYFNGDYLNTVFPEIDVSRHLGSVLLRYLLNMLLSLGIIYLIFNNLRLTYLSGLIFLSLFILLIPVYYGFIYTEYKILFTAGFYVRRLLIQPLMLLVLIPAIWYYKEKRN